MNSTSAPFTPPQSCSLSFHMPLLYRDCNILYPMHERGPPKILLFCTLITRPYFSHYSRRISNPIAPYLILTPFVPVFSSIPSESTPNQITFHATIELASYFKTFTVVQAFLTAVIAAVPPIVSACAIVRFANASNAFLASTFCRAGSVNAAYQILPAGSHE